MATIAGSPSLTRLRWARATAALAGLIAVLAGLLTALYTLGPVHAAPHAPWWLLGMRAAFVSPPALLFATVWAFIDAVPRALRPGTIVTTAGLALWMSYDLLGVWIGTPAWNEEIDLAVSGVVVVGMVGHLLWALMESRSARIAAESDPLTGLLNRAGAQRAWAAVPAGEDISLAVVDLNELKRVNDSLGHLAGDRFILASATSLARACGDQGWVARWGGDEFLVALPGLSEQEARSRLNAAEASVPLKVGNVPVWSAGVVQAEAGQDLRQAMNVADARLYQQKASQYRCIGHAPMQSSCAET